MSLHTPDSSRTPLVSVCVPTYNGAAYLDACLDSLLDQDLQDLEVVIGDDNSSDDTLVIARRRKDPRVRVLAFEENAGMAGNWNRCLAEARGEYVALVAQDDLVARVWGERLVELLESHPEADLAFGRRDFDLVDEHTRGVAGEFFETKYPALLESFYARIDTVIPPELMIDAALEHRFKINLIGEPSFTMVRRDHPVTRAGYHAEMRQLLDWEFAMRFFADKPILHCPESLGTYRIHAAGESVGKVKLSYHYEEYGYLLDSVLVHLKDRLGLSQTSILEERREEIEHLVQLLGHSRTVQADRDQLELHAGTIEVERRALLAHVETLESEREHLHGHLRNLEKIVRKTHAEGVYRVLCRIKDTFVRTKSTS